MEQQIMDAVMEILPFELSTIESVEENCGIVWIELKNGNVYSIACAECEITKV